MGILSSIGDAIGGAAKKLGSSALEFGGKFLEDELLADPNSANAYERQRHFYKHRYRWMMKDMKKAGLNPILAAGSAGFNTSGTPSVQQSTLPTGSYSSAYESMQKGQLAEEQTKTEKVEQLKTMAETKSEIARKYEVRQRAQTASAEETKFHTESQKNIKEIIRIVSQTELNEQDKERLAALTKQLQYQLNQLSNIADVYSSDAGKILTIIGEIMKSLNLGGIITRRIGK